MKKRIRIEIDTDPVNPLENRDMLCTMACFHRRYRLGHTDHGIHSEDFTDWDAMRGYIVNRLGAVAILPLYMYDHSGLVIATTPFSCRWDSGQLGFAYVTRKTAYSAYAVKRITAPLRARITKVIEAEVALYAAYVTGDVYGYVTETRESEHDEWEQEDAYWGYYGNDHDASGLNADIARYVADGYEVQNA